MSLAGKAHVPMKSSLRRRLLAVACLSVISCAVALGALVRILSLTSGQRADRARETLVQQLAALHSTAEPSEGLRPGFVLGMRGGKLAEPAAVAELKRGLDDADRDILRRALDKAAETKTRAVLSDGRDSSMRFFGAEPAEGGGYVWIAYTVPPPTFLPFWRFIVISLTAATVLLVATAISIVVNVKRGVAELNTSLTALADDLTAPVPRPPLHELAELGDGIAKLAEALADARIEEERLGTELSRRERLAALGRVAAGVAHEVRNPLASIKLRVDLGRRRATTPPELASELGFVSDEITRLDRLVADMLIVAGRSRGPRATTELGGLVEHRAGLLRPWADERGVRIEVSGKATADIDADAIARAIDNLIRNAVEASAHGATVDVQVDGDSDARVRVCDRGAGVDQARAGELFEPFFTTKPEGTGLGLALSRAIIAAHDGALTYARDGGVTCFELSLPRLPRSRPRPGVMS